MPLKEACGIVGIASDTDVSYELFTALRTLQHRGQESAGISIFDRDDKRIVTTRGMGLVTEAFSDDVLSYMEGNIGIGHVRYSTAGESSIKNAQPIEMHISSGIVSLAHNGELVNADTLRDHYQEKGWAFFTTSDSEIIVRLLSKELHDGREPVSAIKEVMKAISGSYALVILINDRLFAVRDPLGIKPLVLGKRGKQWMVASESVAFDALGAERVRDVEPGEIIEVSEGELGSHMTAGSKQSAHCFFEWVYFSRSDSVLDGVLVYDVRKKIGEALARESPVSADMVIPVPDSGRAHALGYSGASGIQYAEGLMKNRYVDRTFIMPDQKMREYNVSVKLNPIKSMVEGKSVVLVDDSIVRGTTMKKIVSMLREAGAREVHVRIGCPPIIAPCYLGIDMKTREQLIAPGKSIEEIRERIGADSLAYVSIDGLVESIGKNRKELCLGCVSGEYPVEIDGEKHREQSTLEEYLHM